MKTSPTIWHGCYDSGWKGVITRESFLHPAKYSRALIERIFSHCIDRGYLSKGALVGDCFGGIGTGGIAAAYSGLQWVGVELEPRFASLAMANFEFHRDKWRDLGLPQPRIIQGDSRKFDEVVSAAGAIVTSPPYSGIAAGAGGLNTKPPSKPCQQSGRSAASASQAGNWSKEIQRYGKSAGQIATLKEGSLSAVVTSPPFTQGHHGGGGINVEGYDGKQGKDAGVGGRTYQGRRGDRGEANIEILPPGNLSAVVTSPPWEKNVEGGRAAGKLKDPLKSKRGNGASDAAVLAQAERDGQKFYGTEQGQIGNDKGETYWQAMHQVYAACFRSVNPGGVICVVVKDYVKSKQRVPLCDDTARLLEHVGFTVIERIHAMLVKETRHDDLFVGETTTKVSRKSFFRRLAESKGSPEINFEEVIIARKESCG